VDDFVGAGKDRGAVECGLAFEDFEFRHVAPGFQGVAAQDPADRDVGAHELFPHRLGHALEGGEGPCVDEDRASCIEPDFPVVYFASFFYSQERCRFPVSLYYVLGLGPDFHGMPGHYLKEIGNRAVRPAADPEAGGDLQAL